jgi:hypothetical protein
MSHKVDEGGPEKENTIKISVFHREIILISNTADKETGYCVGIRHCQN